MWDIGSLCGKGDFCEELRKRIVDVYCMQEVRWRERGSSIFAIERKFKV